MAFSRRGHSLASAALSVLIGVTQAHAQDASPALDEQPSARSLRGLALEAFELRHYEQAADLLRRALDAQTRPLDGALRVEAAALLVRAEAVLSPVALMLDRVASPPSPERAAHERSAASPAAFTKAAPSLPAAHAAPHKSRWFWASAVVLTCAAAIALGFGLTARSTETSAAISALPVATRGGP